MSATTALNKKKVVVIGCGPAGSQFVAKAAKDKNLEVTVITPFDYHEISLRMTMVVAEGAEEHAKALYPLLREDGVNYIIDTVQSISQGSLITRSGQAISFDAAVIAVGQNIPRFYPDPLTQTTMDARKAAISAFNAEIRHANSIVISGGGPVGSEVAADIKLRFKSKNVTIVHPQSEVLSMMRDQFRILANAQLEKIGVDLVLSDRIVGHDNGEVTLQSGKRIPADLHIVAHALGGNATFLPDGSKDKKGYAVVNDTFLVQGFTSVFALGDCSNYDHVKTYPRIEDQLPTVFANVVAVVQQKPMIHHVKGKSMPGSFPGPVMVAFGHGGVKDAYGVGPDLGPGCCSAFCWFCCFCGPPCSTPAGAGVAKAKTDFNMTIVPKKGVGIHN